MYSNVMSFGLTGIEGYEVSVECNITNGLPAFEMVGLPDTAVREAKERVRSAVKNCGFKFPVSRMTVNLAPAGQKKSGTLYDLPILLGLLSASGAIRLPSDKTGFLGELSLDGRLRSVPGVLSMALTAKKLGYDSLYVPAENAAEAALVEGLTVYPVTDVLRLAAHLRGEDPIEPQARVIPEADGEELLDYCDVIGQSNAKRALEIAAAGGHNVLLIGPPGSGKSMLSKRLPSILPDMTLDEALEVTQLYSIVGMLPQNRPLINRRPFRSPHHTISSAGLAGGGSSPRPGEISLAHKGVLFLDEFPEFRKETLEVLRQPIEDSVVTISRVNGSVTYPSQFMLACAMNPCKCGWYGHPSGRCTCSQTAVDQYLSRISGPLLDRIDIIVEVPSVEFDELAVREKAEPSAEIRKRVNAARQRQRIRFSSDGTKTNGTMGPDDMRRYCVLDDGCSQLMRSAFDRLQLTARSYDRILRVARTIADLEGAEEIRMQDIAEAIQYRSFRIGSK